MNQFLSKFCWSSWLDLLWCRGIGMPDGVGGGGDRVCWCFATTHFALWKCINIFLLWYIYFSQNVGTAAVVAKFIHLSLFIDWRLGSKLLPYIICFYNYIYIYIYIYICMYVCMYVCISWFGPSFSIMPSMWPFSFFPNIGQYLCSRAIYLLFINITSNTTQVNNAFRLKW